MFDKRPRSGVAHHSDISLGAPDLGKEEEGGSSKVRLFHCTSVELTLTITRNWYGCVVKIFIFGFLICLFKTFFVVLTKLMWSDRATMPDITRWGEGQDKCQALLKYKIQGVCDLWFCIPSSIF